MHPAFPGGQSNHHGGVRVQLSCLESMYADVIIKPCLLAEYRRSFHARFSQKMIQWLLTYSESTHCPNKHSSRGSIFFFPAASALCVMSSLNFPLLENKPERSKSSSVLRIYKLPRGQSGGMSRTRRKASLRRGRVATFGSMCKSPGCRPAPTRGDIKICFLT